MWKVFHTDWRLKIERRKRQMADVPNTRMFNFVDTPANIHYSQFGEAQVPLDPQTGSIIDISGFRRINIRIGSTKAKTFSVFIGKNIGATRSQDFNQPIDNQTHTFEVIGPQMNLFLKGGPPNSQ